VTVLVALSLILLVGVTSLAIDGGSAYNERRATQNAADHSALAAAWAACNGDDPDDAAEQSATLNGYTATDVTVTPEGDAYRVEVVAVQTNNFGGAVGAPQTTIRSEAVAECDATESAGDYAIFAGGPSSCSGSEIDAPNASKNITGGVHSNGDINSTGATANYWGDVTHVGSFNTNHPTAFHNGFELGSWKDYPVPDSWVMLTYAPGGSRAVIAQAAGQYQSFNGNRSFNSGSLHNNRLIYVNGNVTINSGPGLSRSNVTIVATGSIQMAGVSTMLTPYEPDGLVLFSNFSGGSPSCSNVAIHGSAAGNAWQGVMFAPYGQIRLNNATSMTLSGALIGYRVNLAGAGTNISNNTAYGGAPEFRVEMTE
jgi:Tfp pilus assembly protein PilV